MKGRYDLSSVGCRATSQLSGFTPLRTKREWRRRGATPARVCNGATTCARDASPSLVLTLAKLEAFAIEACGYTSTT
eukprot:3725061-Pleurochrysis_carterae.AAC.3